MEARYMADLEWRICHAVNIYLYRNGREGESPILVHVPPDRRKNMRTLMLAIQDRVKYPVGYASYLYRMDGKRIRHPCELEMYNNYVVASNYDKHFKCVQYGRKRSPLIVLNRDSKHIRVLRQQNQSFNEWILKKKAMGEERPQYNFYPPYYTSEPGTKEFKLHELQMAHFGGNEECMAMPNNRGDQLRNYNNSFNQHFVVNKCMVEMDQTAANTINQYQNPSSHKLPELRPSLETPIVGRPPNNSLGDKPIKKSSIRLQQDLNNNNLSSTSQTMVLHQIQNAKFDGGSTESENNSEVCETMDSEVGGGKYHKALRKFKKKVKHPGLANAQTSDSSIDRQQRVQQEFALTQAHEGSSGYLSPAPRGSRMLVLPPPPEEFRDDKGFLSDE